MMTEVSQITGYSYSFGFAADSEEFGVVSGLRSSPYGGEDLP
jgi:hypothetical protein